jgi:hypothetical protein
MAQDPQVGLEVRPPLAVEKNHPKKTGGGKRCCGILSPFQISWETKNGQPNRPSPPENRCLFSAASGLKMGTSSVKPPDADKGKEAKLTLRDCIGFLAEIVLILWLWANLVECHNIAALIIYFVALFIAQSAVCYSLFAVFRKCWWIWLAWIGLNILTSGVVYNNSLSPPNETKRYPHFSFSVNTSGNPQDDVALTNDFLAYTNFGKLATVLGILFVPVSPGQTNITLTLLCNNASSVTAEDVQVIVLLSKDLESVFSTGWDGFNMPETRFESNNQTVAIESQLARLPFPVLPGDGQYLPKIKICVPNSRSAEFVLLSGKAKDSLKSAIFFQIVSFSPFTNSSNIVIDKPFVALKMPTGTALPNDILYSK